MKLLANRISRGETRREILRARSVTILLEQLLITRVLPHALQVGIGVQCREIAITAVEGFAQSGQSFVVLVASGIDGSENDLVDEGTFGGLGFLEVMSEGLVGIAHGEVDLREAKLGRIGGGAETGGLIEGRDGFVIALFLLTLYT
jgi:hypothetical protein